MTSCIKVIIYDHCQKLNILNEEQKGCVKECFGCKEQIIIDTVIMEQARKNNRNIYTAFVDYKKAYDSVPHSWLIKILKIYKINLDLINFLSHVMTFWRTTLNLSINNTKLKSEPIQIKRGIYQGDSLSPLWFCLAINPLTNLLNSTGYGFNIRLNNTTLSKLNHLLCMDDIKLPKSAIERFNLPRENGGWGFSNLEILQLNQIASLKNYFLNRARANTFFNVLVSADKGYTPLDLSDNLIHV
jgi:hypothetical protein